MWEKELNETLRRAEVLHGQGKLGEAERLYQSVLSSRPRDANALHHLGVLRCQQSRYQDGAQCIRAALSLEPRLPDAHFNLGLALQRLNLAEEAVAAFDDALACSPRQVSAHYQRGVSIARLGRIEDALSGFDQVLLLEPNHQDAQLARGVMLGTLDRHAEACNAFQSAADVWPNDFRAWNYLGICLMHLDRHVDALRAFDEAAILRSEDAEIWTNRGKALNKLGEYEDAYQSCERALQLRPDLPDALVNQGLSLSQQRRYAEAIDRLDLALKANPSDPIALYNRGNALGQLGRNSEAIASYDRALAIKPNYPEALYNLGNQLRINNELDRAIESYELALAFWPDHRYAFGNLAYCELGLCNWEKLPPLTSELAQRAQTGLSIVSPFTALALSDDPFVQLQCAKSYVSDRVKDLPLRRHDKKGCRSDRLRIAYLSADFRTHPVGGLIPQLIETHDRRRFEVVGLSIGPDDFGEQRKRLVKAFDQFHDLNSVDDLSIALQIQNLDCHILVDLNGHTEFSRSQVLAYRPAPLQFQYLGYPGTSGASFIDYMIADQIVLPREHEGFYTERVIRLPDTFFVNDTTKAISDVVPSRRDLGLPDDGLVFCCFNASYKFTPKFFDIWMRLLLKVEGSVLWLSKPSAAAVDNLRRETGLRGVNPERIVFADRVPHLADHLARLIRADIFLDTLPYNAHTTAAEALWAGLPVITCKGTTFAGRVGASLLTAAGMPELVTTSLTEYEALALEYASDASARVAVKQKLRDQRNACPLFDTQRFCRHLEKAYQMAWDLHAGGNSPVGFDVPSCSELKSMNIVL